MALIVNIINFIRGTEPRLTIDLIEPVREQVALLDRLSLPGTFLFQYDALIDPQFRGMIDSARYEVGLWLELVQPLVEKAGVKWRGRYSWDWHADVAFCIGYTPDERRRIIDVAMAEFYKHFGHYPESVGAWLLDAVSLAHLQEKYGVVAACICKDQIGTDGYTLWGGYWNQAYYPSKRNGFIPAQTAGQQIDIPVFRMLGSDPIEQYELGLGTDEQKVASLEPVYEAGGGTPGWIDWFFGEMRRPTLGFGYAQVGQENSFGWPRMARGLTYQCEELARMQSAGGVRVMTLGDAGRWFKAQYPQTPTTTVTVLDDYEKKSRRTVWHNTRHFRMNVFWDDRHVRVRDIHVFREAYAERYLDTALTSPRSVFDALPVVDGFSWSSSDHRANLRLVDQDGRQLELSGEAVVQADDGTGTLAITWPLKAGDVARLVATEKAVCWSIDGSASWLLSLQVAEGKQSAITGVDGNRIVFRHNGFEYSVVLKSGEAQWKETERQLLIAPEAGRVEMILS